MRYWAEIIQKYDPSGKTLDLVTFQGIYLSRVIQPPVAFPLANATAVKYSGGLTADQARPSVQTPPRVVGPRSSLKPLRPTKSYDEMHRQKFSGHAGTVGVAY
jgi:hypothetical protein